VADSKKPIKNAKNDKETAQLKPIEKELAAEIDKADEAAGVPKKKKKKSTRLTPQAEVMWNVRVENFFKGTIGTMFEVLMGIFSKDRPTRQMSLLFLFFLLGTVSVSVVAVKHYIEYQELREKLLSMAREQEAKNLGEFLRKQSDEAKHRFSTIVLGTFNIDVKPAPDETGGHRSSNMAEVEIVLLCDHRETRYYIEENIASAKNQVTNVLLPQTRDELMSREGKRRLKKMIIEKINMWLPKGKIEDLYFNKFIIG
jgi:hypothetical protein